MNKLIRYLWIIAAVSAVVAIVLVGFDYFQTRGRFPHPTFIGKVEVSGLSQEEALSRLSALNLPSVYTPVITFEVEKKAFTFTPDQAGIKVNLSETIRRAYRATHDAGYLRELRERLKWESIAQPLLFDVDEDKLQTIVKGIADEIETTPKDASIQLYEETGGYHIEGEDLGRAVKINDTIKAFKTILAANEKVFPVMVAYTQPRVTEKDLRAFPPAYRLAAFTTYYGRHDSPNRIYNIKLMSSWVDGTLLLSGETFSLVDKIGDFTPERGFKEAYVIYGGVLVPMLGGGGCQVGTTLYNAVALADLDILSRQNHSFYFNIYPLGRDATIYPGQKDLKFRNNTGHPVLIKAVATNKRLSFRVYGTPTGKKVEFSPAAVYILTSSGYKPSTVGQVLGSDSPFKTSVIRRVYDAAGKKIKEETINSSYKLYGERSNVPIARPEPR